MLGLQVFEAICADIADLGEEHSRLVLPVCGKGAKIGLVALPRQSAGPSAAGSAGRSRA
jgi:hypothetical protein